MAEFVSAVFEDKKGANGGKAHKTRSDHFLRQGTSLGSRVFAVEGPVQKTVHAHGHRAETHHRDRDPEKEKNARNFTLREEKTEIGKRKSEKGMLEFDILQKYPEFIKQTIVS